MTNPSNVASLFILIGGICIIMLAVLLVDKARNSNKSIVPDIALILIIFAFMCVAWNLKSKSATAEPLVCSNCNIELDASDTFCSSCGASCLVETPITNEPTQCMNCNNELDPSDAFCSKCGSSVHMKAN